MTDKTSIFALEAPIERQSLAEIVAKHILQMVTSGTLKAGDQIPPERELAELIGVSRPSVREAIRGLSILGVVKSRQGGGAYISALDADSLLGPIRFFLSLDEVNITELYDARSLIESNVARRAAANMSVAQLAALNDILNDQKATMNNPEAFRDSDFKFHELIWEGSGNGFLKKMGESLNSIGLEFRRRASVNPKLLEQSFEDHQRLYTALKNRDLDGAAKAAEAHMNNVYHATISQDIGG